MRDIASKEDCRALVESFYLRVRADGLLGPIFTRLDGAWPEHMGKMADFWAAVVLAMPGYEGRPLERHIGLGIDTAHFERWLSIWTATVDAQWCGPNAEQAKRSAQRIATRMLGILSGGSLLAKPQAASMASHSSAGSSADTLVRS